jgi:hypothetical protein
LRRILTDILGAFIFFFREVFAKGDNHGGRTSAFANAESKKYISSRELKQSEVKRKQDKEAESKKYISSRELKRYDIYYPLSRSL